MNWIDIVVIGGLALGSWSGARKGFVRQTVGLTSLVASFLIGYLNMESMGAWIGSQAEIPAEYEVIAGFILVFIAVQLCFMILSRFLNRIVKNTPILGGMNKIIGAGLGLLSAGFLLSLGFYLGSVFGFPSIEARSSSALYDTVYQFLPYAWNMATQQFPEIAELADRFPTWF